MHILMVTFGFLLSTKLLAALPESFVYLDSIAPSIKIDMKYYSEDNFLGEKVDGYQTNRCILTKAAAEAIKNVQADLTKMGLTLRIFDCYRPQQAVDHFVRWAKDLKNTKNKASYYPKVDKQDLFTKGYIAEKSGHSRGSTVDLTIDGLDMGSRFDFFDPRSHTANPDLDLQIRANRSLLVSIMRLHHFKNLDEEWWHFTLESEPFKDTYFNHLVK